MGEILIGGTAALLICAKSSRIAPGSCAAQRSASKLPSAFSCSIGPQAVSRTGKLTGAAPATRMVSTCVVSACGYPGVAGGIRAKSAVSI